MSKTKTKVNNINICSNDDSFGVLDRFYESDKRWLARHIISSDEQLIEHTIPLIVAGNNIISEKIVNGRLYRSYVTFENLMLESPSHEGRLLFPLEALQKRLSYYSKYTATITQYQEVVDIETGESVVTMIDEPMHNHAFARIFIVVGSKYCNLTRHPEKMGKHCKHDVGGYYIVSGGEKVVVTLATTIPRKPMVYYKKEQNVSFLTCISHSKHADQNVGIFQQFAIRMKKDGTIVTDNRRFREISVFTLIRALGLVADGDIIDVIADSDKDTAIIDELNVAFGSQNNVLTQEEAIKTLMSALISSKTYIETDAEAREKQKRMYLIKVLSKEILPHVVSNTDNAEMDMLYKAYFVAYMVRKLLKCFIANRNKEASASGDADSCDDRDSEFNKRFEPSGILLGEVFFKDYKKMLRDLNKVFGKKKGSENKPPNIIVHIKPNTIEQGQRQSLTTGNFGSSSKSGLAMPFSRVNHLHAMSSLRRVASPSSGSTNKLTKPRFGRPPQYGTVCPFETPSSIDTGLINNLAMMCGITTNLIDQHEIILEYLAAKITPLEEVDKHMINKWVKIVVNNNIIGGTPNVDAIKIYEELREMRFNGTISRMVGMTMYYREKEFHIRTDAGRAIRPFFTVTNNVLNFKPEMLKEAETWNELLAKYPKIIEYLDKEEELNLMLAITPHDLNEAYKIMNKEMITDHKTIFKINQTNRYDGQTWVNYTHCEIHPSVILGVVSSNITYINHIQTPRGMYQYNQARYANGIPDSDYPQRYDNTYLLYHTQVPVVSTRSAKYTGSQLFPAGENTVILIASYGGYNQEDSIIMNQSSVDRCFFGAQTMKKYIKTAEKNQASSQTDIFLKPDRNRVDGMKRDANYDTLSENGYALEETVINTNDAIIGMVKPKPIVGEGEKPYVDDSIIHKGLETAVIDKVFVDINSDGYDYRIVRIRSENRPNIGDKFACYDSMTEILTSKGWIMIKDLTIQHRVATLTKNGAIFEYPQAIQRYDYNGIMHRVYGYDVDLLVTPNHNMLVSDDGEHFELRRADKITYPMYYGNNNSISRVFDHNVVNYSGEVYCCTVSSGIIYVRRNGKEAWCGNSRNGQKGVCGWLCKRKDLPFSENGLVPNIILNPNAFPKRMTIGQIIEGLVAKVCCIKGIYADATAFVGTDIRAINDELIRLGGSPWGREVMYNGVTGRKMDIKMYIFFNYYLKLRQRVLDKMFQRSLVGPNTLLTKQPTAGKAREGALRLGEMERDAVCAHGMSFFLRERFMESSDIYKFHVCDKCGLIVGKIIGQNNYRCTPCSNSSNISTVVAPYCFKLLIQELQSMNIVGRIRTANHIAV